ncbi:MAG: FGGY-family carbohydrate kinase, partial [Dehalococcoidia bacterium]
NLGLIASSSEGAELAASVDDSGGVVFVPAFVGLGSPHWGPDARGAIFGLTGASTKAHLVRAALESIVFQAQDVIETMGAGNTVLRELRVDGGAAANDMLMQMQADLSGRPVVRPASIESTAMGAAYLAGLATGFWQDEAALLSLPEETTRFEPGRGAEAARRAYERWKLAVRGLLATELPPA